MEKNLIKNSRHDVLQHVKQLDLIIFSCLVLLFLSLFWIVFFPDFFIRNHFFTGFFLLGIVASTLILKTIKFQFFKRMIEPKVLRADPVILLAAVGVDLEEYSHLINLNLQSLDDIILEVNSHLKELNQKISLMGHDIGNVYTIVSKLAAEEVTLMDAVGKTSTEINIMFDIVNTVIDEIQGRNKTMEELVERSHEGGEKVKKTGETIKRISESSGGILKLIDFINGVSKETNLLAINASIEATHSGSEGKGFTVIADEIRKLATQTAQNAREITKLLRNNIVDYGLASNASTESGQAFEFIASEIHVVHGTIAEVIQSIAELKTRGSIVLDKAKSLDEIAERVRDTSGEVYGEVININGSLEETQSLSDKIQVECENMKQSKDWLNRLTKKMQDKVKEISRETDKFLREE
ncbi:MAG: methyl-accepting chemotaxis protein [Leptospira sp.]|nr:methyl-accepting chemotaxis protein [Leptospira sp.]